MPVNSLVTSVEVLFKVGIILALLAYFIFSLLVLRQVTMMTETVQTEGGPVLKVLAWMHAIFSLGMLLWVISWYS